MYPDTGISRFQETLSHIFRLQRRFYGVFHGRSFHRNASRLSRDLQDRRTPLFQSDLHSCFCPVRFMQISRPDLCEHALIASGVAWFVEGDHLPPVVPLIIAGLKLAADIQTLQPVQIFTADPAGLPPFPDIQIDIFAVKRRDARGIFGLFHAAFYFEGINAGFDQLRQVSDRTHVL